MKEFLSELAKLAKSLWGNGVSDGVKELIDSWSKIPGIKIDYHETLRYGNPEKLFWIYNLSWFNDEGVVMTSQIIVFESEGLVLVGKTGRTVIYGTKEIEGNYIEAVASFEKDVSGEPFLSLKYRNGDWQATILQQFEIKGNEMKLLSSDQDLAWLSFHQLFN